MSGSAQGTVTKANHRRAGQWEFEFDLRTRLLVMQPTPFCNIACDYCYLAHRNDKRRMSPEVVTATAQRLMEADLLGDALGIVWHAGEPLVAAPEFYETSFRVFADTCGRATHLQHSIQTNGMLIDERWCDLFKRWNVRVGVSVDGPADIHDKHRKTRQGKPTHDAVMRGIECLQRADIPFHVIAVATADAVARADDIFDFFVRSGIREVGFNVDELEGVNRHCSIDAVQASHSTFVRRLLERSLEHPGQLHVRELEVAAHLILSALPEVTIGGGRYPDNSQILPFAILSVAANGDFTTFSPELIDQAHPRHGSFVFGNVLHDSLQTMLAQPRFVSIFEEIMAGVERCRASCSFFAFCGGGAPANKLGEQGTLSCAETAYCRAVVQRPLEQLLDYFESMPAATASPSEAAKARHRVMETC